MSLQNRWKKADPEVAAAYLAPKPKIKKPRKRKKRSDAGKPKDKMLVKVESRKGGRMSESEKELIERFLLSRPEGETLDTSTRRAKALAVVMGRSVETVRAAIVKAADLLAQRSEEYADLHFVATKIAATKGDAAPSQWALERISAESADGKGRVRIVEPLKSDSDTPMMPTINIGLALGGIPDPGRAIKQIPAGPASIPIEIEDAHPDEDEGDVGDEP